MEYPDKSHLFARLCSVPRELELLATGVAASSGQWTGGANLNPQILQRLKKTSLITSSGASTRIEGAKLSDEEIRAMIGGLRWKTMKDRETQEIKGYYELLSFIYDDFTDIELTENNIKEFHSRLLKYTEKDVRHRGEYKKLENHVEILDPNGHAITTLFATSTALETPEQMRELVEWYNDAINDPRYHKIIVIAAFVVQFLKIHPFQDGNGRLSRILTDLLMLRAHYEYVPYVSLEKIIEENKADYYIALRASQLTFGKNNESITDWLTFFLNICQVQVRQAMSLLSVSRLEQGLSEKQRVIWDYFKTHSSEEIAISQIERATKINRETAKQSLEKLLGLKLINRLGAGRSTRYVVNRDVTRIE